MMACAAGLAWCTQTRSVGFGVSADTDAIADTVRPNRPASPSVVTMFTVEAAKLMPERKLWRSSGSWIMPPSVCRLGPRS